MNSKFLKIYIISLFFCIIFTTPQRNIGFRLDFSLEASNNSSNSSSLEYLFSHILSSPVCLGIDPQCFSVPLSFSTYSSWICTVPGFFQNVFFNASLSVTNKCLGTNHVISAMNKVLYGTPYQDILTTPYNEKTIINFSGVSECGKLQGEIGLNMKDLLYVSRTNDSLIEQLFNNNVIDSEIFSIRYTNKTHGYVILGDSYDEYDNMKYSEISTTSYSIVTSGRYVEMISFFSKKNLKNGIHNSKINYMLNRRLVLDFSSSFVSLPYDIFEIIRDKIFKNLLLNKICNFEKTENEIFYIICSKSVFQKITLDTFVIYLGRNSKIEFGLLKMFVIYKDKFICGIVGKKDYTYITLGDTYLRKHIVLFNIKEKMIRFYPKDAVLGNVGYNVLSLLIWFIFGMGLIVCVTNMVYEIFIKRKSLFKLASGRRSSIKLIEKNKFERTQDF